ncbi:MAG: class I SAM-dependent methyltransferase [candidate division Zixibacteria bacterium]
MSRSVKNRAISQKINGYKSLLRYHFRQTREFARHDFEVYKEIVTATANYIKTDNASSFRVLDIGCGQRYANTLLFSNEDNHEAFGVDTDIVGPGLSKYPGMIRHNGIERTVKSAVRELLFDPIYFGALNRCAGKKLDKRKLKILNADAGNLPFEDNFFDLVVSNAVFEHIENIPVTLEELNRICKPDAAIYILIHLHSSLSGGHNMRWAFPEENVPDNVPPWDHLRDNEFPTHIYLNKMREAEYRSVFMRYTEILEWIDGPYEGEALITDHIRRELSEYSDEELLKRYVTVICQPKPTSVRRSTDYSQANKVEKKNE